MFRNETTDRGAMSFGHEPAAAEATPALRRSGWIARYLPVPIMVGGMVATIAWMSLVGWWVFTFVRWSIG